MTDYITSANFKTRHGITVATNDARIVAHCTAASREVDSICHRRFDGDSVATARYFPRLSNSLVLIDDAWEIASVATDDGNAGAYSTAWATTDWYADPPNGVGPNGQSGWPVEALWAVGSRLYPIQDRPAVKVTAKWGWAAVPTDVVEATYLLAHRLFYEVAVPSGVVPGGPDFNGAPLQRPWTVERLLAPFLKAAAGVA